MVIVVPVHDEDELLDRCLTALTRSIECAEVPCVVRVVLDHCSDGSAAVAARHPHPAISIDAHAVGAARAAGVDSALAELAGVPTERIWIANTDADSAVPTNWITAQCARADAGADLVLGTVKPDFRDLSPAHRAHWIARHIPGSPAGNTYGANLGIRADAYLSAGGFADVALHEDVGLVERCRARDATIVACDDAEVLTSGRHVGRASGGYADFIRATASGLRDNAHRRSGQGSAVGEVTSVA